MTTVERIRKVDSILLIVVAVIDLVFGILSLMFEGSEWQICSAIASLSSLTLIARFVIAFPKSKRQNISALVIGSLDVIAGTLSVFLAIYGVKALACATAGLTAFNALKISIQSEKFVNLGKKVLTKFTSLILVAIINKIKRGIEMKNEKITLITANKFTIGFSSVIAVFSALIGWAADYILPIIAPTLNGVWYYVAIVGIALVTFAILEVIVIFLGKDSKASYMIDKIAKNIGLEIALDKLTAFNTEIETKKAEQEKVEHEKEERKKVELLEEYKRAVANGEFDKSFDDYIECAKEKEKEILKQKAENEAISAEQNLKAQWKAEIINGTTSLAYDTWRKNK